MPVFVSEHACRLSVITEISSWQTSALGAVVVSVSRHT